MHMKILSHRGYWRSNEQKNTKDAFLHSFKLGYGTETDIRDFNEKLVISHDIANGNEIDFSSFLTLADKCQTNELMPLALNIKADGLALLIRQALDEHSSLDCFVFDMSVPDMRSYFDVNIPVFTRMSEVEQQPTWLEQSTGVWLDGFESEWYSLSLIEALLSKEKRVCIVSPELHHRDHQALWQRIRYLIAEPNLLLCTDYPEQASKFFYDCQ